jgi:hypothetical protein
MNYPTRRDISILAKKYWQEAGSPPAEKTPPEIFWLKAERQATPTIILAIADKLRQHGILRLAGDVFYQDFYYDDEFSPPILFAQGKLEANGIYIVRITGVGNSRFDLNEEKDLDKLITCLVDRKELNRRGMTKEEQERERAKSNFAEISAQIGPEELDLI